MSFREACCWWNCSANVHARRVKDFWFVAFDYLAAESRASFDEGDRSSGPRRRAGVVGSTSGRTRTVLDRIEIQFQQIEALFLRRATEICFGYDGRNGLCTGFPKNERQGRRVGQQVVIVGISLAHFDPDQTPAWINGCIQFREHAADGLVQ